MLTHSPDRSWNSWIETKTRGFLLVMQILSALLASWKAVRRDLGGYHSLVVVVVHFRVEAFMLHHSVANSGFLVK